MILSFVLPPFPNFWMNQINDTIPYKTYVLYLLCWKKSSKLTNHSESHDSPTLIETNKKKNNQHNKQGIGYPTALFLSDLAWLSGIECYI